MAFTFVALSTPDVAWNSGDNIDLPAGVAAGDFVMWGVADDAQSFFFTPEFDRAAGSSYGSLKVARTDEQLGLQSIGKTDTFGSDGTAWWGWAVLDQDDVDNGFLTGPVLSGSPAGVALSAAWRGTYPGTKFPFFGDGGGAQTGYMESAVNTNTNRRWPDVMTPPFDDMLIAYMAWEDALVDPGEHTIDAAWTSAGYGSATSGAATIHIAYDIQTTATQIPANDVVYGTADNDEYGVAGMFVLSDDSLVDERAFMNDIKARAVDNSTDWTPHWPDVNSNDTIVIVLLQDGAGEDPSAQMPSGYTEDADAIFDTDQIRYTVWYKAAADGAETVPTITLPAAQSGIIYAFTVKNGGVPTTLYTEETSDVDDTFPTGAGVTVDDLGLVVGMAVANDTNAGGEFDNITSNSMWEMWDISPFQVDEGVTDVQAAATWEVITADSTTKAPVFEFSENMGNGGTLLFGFDYTAAAPSGPDIATFVHPAIMARAHGRRN